MVHLNANQEILKLKVPTVTVNCHTAQDTGLWITPCHNKGCQASSALSRVDTAVGISTLKSPTSCQKKAKKQGNPYH